MFLRIRGALQPFGISRLWHRAACRRTVMGHQGYAQSGRPVLFHAPLCEVWACRGGAGRDGEGCGDGAGQAALVQALGKRRGVQERGGLWGGGERSVGVAGDDEIGGSC